MVVCDLLMRKSPFPAWEERPWCGGSKNKWIEAQTATAEPTLLRKLDLEISQQLH